MPLALILLLLSLAYAGSFCIKEVENETNEPYLSYALLRTLEKAVLEVGGDISCSGDFREIRVKVRSFRELPIAYTPQHRVSSYNLSLSVEIQVEGSSFVLSGTVPYTLPSGGLGDIPRRSAVDDLVDKIYLDLIKNLRRFEDADKSRDQKKR